MAARVGFDSIEIGIYNEEGYVNTVHVIDANEGGAISAEISGLAAQTATTYASNVPFHAVAQGTGQVEASVEIADLPFDVQSAITGATMDANGIIKYGSETRPPDVAVIFKSHGRDGNAIYFSLLKAKASYDSVGMNTQEDGAPELQTDSITFTAVARNKEVYAIGTDAEKYEEFKSYVFPTAKP